MTFEEYASSERFRKHLEDIGRGKRYNKYFLIGWGIAILLAIGAAVCTEWLPQELQTPPVRIFGYVLLAVSLAALLALSVVGAKFSGRDDNGNRPLVYTAAMLLYARQYLADDWQAKNGVIDFSVELCMSAAKSLSVRSATLVCGESKKELDLAAFEGTLELPDFPAFVLFGLFTHLEGSAASLAAIRCTFCTNGEVGKPVFLVSNGKWTWTGRVQRSLYRRAVRYARRKGLIR